MAKDKIDIRFGVIALMILTAAFCRLIPHPPNFAPIGAMALFGAAHFRTKWAALLVPMAALLLSDIAVNNLLYANYYKSFTVFYDGFGWIYGATALTVLLGFLIMRKVNPATVAGGGIVASILFFLVTNFGSWAAGTALAPGGVAYAGDISGLISAYVAGIPFFGGTVAGNLFYAALMFGGFELAQRSFPGLRTGMTATSAA